MMGMIGPMSLHINKKSSCQPQHFIQNGLCNEVGNIEKEVQKLPSNFVEHQLSLVAQDEMIAQANDTQAKKMGLT
jgi:hypothetical protein